MGSGLGIKIVAGLGIGIFVLASFLSEGVLPNGRLVLQTIGVVGVLAAAYERVLWRWIPYPKKPPVLQGTWKLVLTLDTGPGGTTPARATLRCYACIRQTAWASEANVLFDEDDESLINAAFLVRRPNRHQLLIFYDFRPGRWSDHSPRRTGAAWLDINVQQHGQARRRYYRVKLKGQFWSDVLTRGSIESHGRSRKLYDSFGDAEQGTFLPDIPWSDAPAAEALQPGASEP